MKQFLIMKIAILAFIAPDVRSGEVVVSEMKPYNEVLAGFKEIVSEGQLPAPMAAKGFDTMVIWTKNGQVKKHRFPMPADLPATEPEADYGSEQVLTESFYDQLKGDELRECIRQRNESWKEEFHIKPVPSKNADMIAALVACDTLVAEATEADPEFSPIANLEPDPTPSPEPNPNDPATNLDSDDSNDDSTTSEKVSDSAPTDPETPESVDGDGMTAAPEDTETPDSELDLDDETGEDVPLETDSTDEE